MDSDFKKWMDLLGFNGKEVTKAGGVIGIGQTSARERFREAKELTLTERLAMAAVVAGIPPWEAATAKEIAMLGRILRPIQEALSEKSQTPRMAASGHRIPEA